MFRRSTRPSSTSDSTPTSSEQEEPLYPEAQDRLYRMSDPDRSPPYGSSWLDEEHLENVYDWSTHVRNAVAPPLEPSPTPSPVNQLNELAVHLPGKILAERRGVLAVIGECAAIALEDGVVGWDKLYGYFGDLKMGDLMFPDRRIKNEHKAVVSIMVNMLDRLAEMYRKDRDTRARMSKNDARYQIKVFTYLDQWQAKYPETWTYMRRPSDDRTPSMPCADPHFWQVHHRLLASVYGPQPGHLDLSGMGTARHAEHYRCKLDHFGWREWGEWWDSFHSAKPYWQTVQMVSLSSNNLIYDPGVPPFAADISPIDFPRRLLPLCTKLRVLDVSHNPLLSSLPYSKNLTPPLRLVADWTDLTPEAPERDLDRSMEPNSPLLVGESMRPDRPPSLGNLVCRMLLADGSTTCWSHSHGIQDTLTAQSYLRYTYTCDGCGKFMERSRPDSTRPPALFYDYATWREPAKRMARKFQTDPNNYIDKVLVLFVRKHAIKHKDLGMPWSTSADGFDSVWARVYARFCVPCFVEVYRLGRHRFVGWKPMDRAHSQGRVSPPAPKCREQHLASMSWDRMPLAFNRRMTEAFARCSQQGFRA